jgi:hypothetical protein
MDQDKMVELFSSVLGLGIAFVALLIGIAIIWFLQTCYARIPREHRKMEPGMVWLLLIPLFNIIWMFFVYIRLAKSYQSAYAALGRHDVGDCGEKLALYMCIASVASAIPFVGCIAGPASLVLWIVVMVKFAGLKSELPAAA